MSQNNKSQTANMTFGLQEYLNHIGFTGSASPNLETLQQLSQLHPQRFSFESLNTFLQKPVNLGIDAITEKFFKEGRGGYCFEQNTLFAHILKLIGFEVKYLTARSLWNKPEGVESTKTHMLLMVQIEDEAYVSDVGFGGLTLTGSLKFELDIEQVTPHELFRIIAQEDAYVLQAKIKELWKPIYLFDLQEQKLHDFEVPNWFVSTHPQSRFASTLIVAKPEPGKRYVLMNNEYTVYHTEGHIEKRRITDPQEIKDLLVDTFKINLNGLEGLDAKLEEVVKL